LPAPKLTAVRVRSARIIRAYIHSATLYHISRGVPRGFSISACGTCMLLSTGYQTESKHIYLSIFKKICCAYGSRLNIPRHQHKLRCNSATSYSFLGNTHGVRNSISWGNEFTPPLPTTLKTLRQHANLQTNVLARERSSPAPSSPPYVAVPRVR
jgi:hypothetical protein